MSVPPENRIAAIERDMADLKLQMTALCTAFVLDDLGRPSFDHHRMYHLQQAKKAQELDSIKLDVTKRIVQTIMTGAGLSMGMGVLYWAQQVIGK